MLRLGFPEAYGGHPGDLRLRTIATEELCRPAAGAIPAGLMSHGIACPPIAAGGSEELKARVLTHVPAGEAIAALAITEPRADPTSPTSRRSRDVTATRTW